MKKLMLLFILLPCFLFAQDVVVHVDGEISSSGDGLTRATAYKTIVEAVAHSPEPNQVHIWPSSYTAISVDITGKGSLSKPMRFIGREESLERVYLSGGADMFYGTISTGTSFAQFENLDMYSTGDGVRYCTAVFKSVNYHAVGRIFNGGTSPTMTDAFEAYDCLFVADGSSYLFQAASIQIYNSTVRSTGATAIRIMAVPKSGTKLFRFINSVIWAYDNSRTFVSDDAFRPNTIEVRNSRFYNADTTGLTGAATGLNPIVSLFTEETGMLLNVAGSPNFTYELSAVSPLRGQGVNSEVIGAISKSSGVRIGK